MARPRIPLVTRFWAQVDKSGECWVWTGAKDKDGYGKIGIEPRPGGIAHVDGRAHRVAWFVHHGAWPPDDLMVLHECDNPSCIRPEHLKLGDGQQNMLDMKSRNRQGQRGRGKHAKGSDAPLAKLTEDEVRRIRRLANTNMTQQEIADGFGISDSTVRDIIKGRSWGWLK